MLRLPWVALGLAATLLSAGLCHAAPTKKQAVAGLNRAAQPFVFTADAVETTEVYHSVSLDLLKAALERQGLAPRVDKDADGDPCLVLTYEKHHATALLYGKPEAFTSLELMAAFEMTGAAEPAKASSWNLKYRYTRAAASEKTYYLMADLDLQGGLTAAAIGRWFGSFAGSLADYVKFIGFE